jgi:hypothetical protein
MAVIRHFYLGFVLLELANEAVAVGMDSFDAELPLERRLYA